MDGYIAKTSRSFSQIQWIHNTSQSVVILNFSPLNKPINVSDVGTVIIRPYH